MTTDERKIDEVFEHVRGNAMPDLDWVAEMLEVDLSEVEEALLELDLEQCAKCGWWFETIGCTDEHDAPLCLDCCEE